jgi:hypothetical protein
MNLHARRGVRSAVYNAKLETADKTMDKRLYLPKPKTQFGTQYPINKQKPNNARITKRKRKHRNNIQSAWSASAPGRDMRGAVARGPRAPDTRDTGDSEQRAATADRVRYRATPGTNNAQTRASAQWQRENAGT